MRFGWMVERGVGMLLVSREQEWRGAGFFVKGMGVLGMSGFLKSRRVLEEGLFQQAVVKQLESRSAL